MRVLSDALCLQCLRGKQPVARLHVCSRLSLHETRAGCPCTWLGLGSGLHRGRGRVVAGSGLGLGLGVGSLPG